MADILTNEQKAHCLKELTTRFLEYKIFRYNPNLENSLITNRPEIGNFDLNIRLMSNGLFKTYQQFSGEHLKRLDWYEEHDIGAKIFRDAFNDLTDEDKVIALEDEGMIRLITDAFHSTGDRPIIAETIADTLLKLPDGIANYYLESSRDQLHTSFPILYEALKEKLDLPEIDYAPPKNILNKIGAKAIEKVLDLHSLDYFEALDPDWYKKIPVVSQAKYFNKFLDGHYSNTFKDGQAVWKGQTTISAVIHELIHSLGIIETRYHLPQDERNQIVDQVNEGITEYLAQYVCDESQIYNNRKAYPDNVLFIERLVEILNSANIDGRSVILQSLLTEDTTPIFDAYELVGGNKARLEQAFMHANEEEWICAHNLMSKNVNWNSAETVQQKQQQLCEQPQLGEKTEFSKPPTDAKIPVLARTDLQQSTRC